jgi:hypothetical protein
LLRARGRHALGVERFRDRAEPMTRGAHRENPLHDGGFVVVDPALDVCPSSVRAQDIEIVVAEHTAAGDMAGACFSQHRVVGALARFLALELVRKRRQRHHDVGESSVRSRSSR